MTTDEFACEALERMTAGGVSTTVLCRFGLRDHPAAGIANIGGTWTDIPIPVIASTDVRMVAIADPPIWYSVT